MSILTALWRHALLLGQGLAALAQLAVLAAQQAFASGGTFTGRITAALTAPAGKLQVFAVLRAFLPNLVLARSLVSAYPNTGTAILSRRADIVDMLSRDADFEVVYQPRMAMITAGENFFLGMQDTPRYTRDVSLMRLAMRREDLPGIVAPFLAQTASTLVAAAPGRMDVPQMLTLPAAVRLLEHYFGTPGPSAAVITDWTTLLFWYLFIDLKADPALDAKASAAASAFRIWLDGWIAQRKAAPAQDDVLGRCLVLQAAGLPGTADADIRNNLVGLLIGELPTTSCAAIQALNVLLSRPDALAGAQAAARAGDDAKLAAYIFEALRFHPVNPVIYRRATRDTAVAQGMLRGRAIPKGTMVMGANLSAMFDPVAVADPGSFRTDRPWEVYMLWGYGMHTCFGAQLNRISLPTILKPLLAKPGLRRAGGAPGIMDTEGTPFPVHLHVEYDG